VIDLSTTPTSGRLTGQDWQHRAFSRIKRRLTRGNGPWLIALLVLTAVGAWPLVIPGTLIGQDAAAYYYPAYAFLGHQLRALELPVWNPNWLAGAPFAGDPQSGWMYAPAMLFFTVLPVWLAIDAFLIFHLLLAGVATYALARTLGMGYGGALVAGVAFEFTGVVYGRSACCPGYYQVASWIPALLLCANLALGSRSWRGRVGWWAGAGFALSQILAVWLGQGAYYALLTLGGFLAYRTLLTPNDGHVRLRTRIGTLVLHGAAVLLLGFGFAAAGLLPRFEFHALSNLADGYSGNAGWASAVGGWDYKQTAAQLLSPSLYDIGGAVLALALLALFVAKTRYATPFFAALTAMSLLLATTDRTPLFRMLAAILPQFGSVHLHYPERTVIAGALGPAMLAGATVSALPYRRFRPVWLIPVAVLLEIARVTFHQTDNATADLARALCVIAVLLLSAMMLRRSRMRIVLPVVIVAMIFLDLFAAGQWFRDNAPYGGFHRVNAASYYGESGAVSFLRDHPDGRYFGYDPGLHKGKEPRLLYYRYQFADPQAMALEVNNRGTVFGIQDVQGYNPIQLQRYVEFMDAINGRSQEYHGVYVLPAGISSPLLNLIGARYILIPNDAPPDRADLAWLREQHPVVYMDDRVTILENQYAFPQAWIVHDAVQVAPGQALSRLDDGTINPHKTALIESAPRPLSRVDPDVDAEDSAVVLSQDANHIRVRAHSNVASLLMLNILHYPSWQATVDGVVSPSFVADHILSAVAIPAGDHIIELRQVSRTLRNGLLITGGSAGLTLLGIAVLPAWNGAAPSRRSRRRRWLPRLLRACVRFRRRV
jgi:hypothetical protein